MRCDGRKLVRGIWVRRIIACGTKVLVARNEMIPACSVRDLESEIHTASDRAQKAVDGVPVQFLEEDRVQNVFNFFVRRTVLKMRHFAAGTDESGRLRWTLQLMEISSKEQTTSRSSQASSWVEQKVVLSGGKYDKLRLMGVIGNITSSTKLRAQTLTEGNDVLKDFQKHPEGLLCRILRKVSVKCWGNFLLLGCSENFLQNPESFFSKESWKHSLQND